MAFVAKADTTNELIEVPVVSVETPRPSLAITCSCVLFAKYYTGRTDISGWAGKIEPLGPFPYPGAFVITREGNGHVAVVTKVDLENKTIDIIEANYQKCKVSTRTISLFDPNIKGYR